MDVYFPHRLIAIIKFKDEIKTNIVSCVASDRFRCPSLNVFFSDSLHQVIFFRPEMYIKKTYLLNGVTC